jgi:hypothetical protein
VTPRTCCQVTVTLVCTGAVVLAVMMPAAVVVVEMGLPYGRRVLMWAFLCAVAAWRTGVRVWHGVGRQWDRTEPQGLPPSGGPRS